MMSSQSHKEGPCPNWLRYLAKICRNILQYSLSLSLQNTDSLANPKLFVRTRTCLNLAKRRVVEREFCITPVMHRKNFDKLCPSRLDTCQIIGEIVRFLLSLMSARWWNQSCLLYEFPFFFPGQGTISGAFVRTKIT